TCEGALTEFIGLAGSQRALYFFGNFSSTRPDFAHPEGEAGAAAVGPNWPGSPRVGGGAQNPNLESTVMALPANAAPNVAGGHDVGASARAPNAGCAAAPGPVFAALAFLAYRRRRPAPSPSMGRGLG